jgi:hypothetical protein
MRRLLLVLCCSATALSAQQAGTFIALPNWNDRTIEDVVTPFTVDASKDKVYAAVKAAYEDLNLTIDMDNRPGGVIGIQRVKGQTMFAGFRMSRLFDCGELTIAVPNADSYRLTIVFLTFVDAQDPSHTRLRVAVVASGVPSTGSRTATVSCGSKGVLEQKLVDLVQAHLK